MTAPYLFASLEKHPLTEKQYQACVSDAQHTLVLAGAGTGKTSTIMGRLAYLWESQLALPEQVLLLAFAVEAAKEIQIRAEHFLEKYPQLGSKKFHAKTFHSMGLSILTRVQGSRPKLSCLVHEQALEEFVKKWVLSAPKEYQYLIQRYFTCCHVSLKTMAMYGHRKADYQDYLGKTIFRSLADDYVQNPVELMIANVLYQLGVAYRYRAHFEKDIYIEKSYYPYRASFFIARYHLYIDVFDIEKSILDAVEQHVSQNRKDSLNTIEQASPYQHLKQYREKTRQIHLQHNTAYIEVYQDTWLENRYVIKKPIAHISVQTYTAPIVNTQQQNWCWQWLSAWEMYCYTLFVEDRFYVRDCCRISERVYERTHQPLQFYIKDCCSMPESGRGGQAHINRNQDAQKKTRLFNGNQLRQTPPIPLLRSVGRIESLLVTIRGMLLYLKSMPPCEQKELETSWRILNDEKEQCQDIESGNKEQWQPWMSESAIKKRMLYQLTIPILKAYQRALRQEKAIDFDDMIVQATHAIQEGLFTVPWSDILIDEFQDISPARFALIQKMVAQKPTLRLFCVGDDWQTIYQFAGSDMNYMRNFQAYVGQSNIVTLDKTFRFNSALCKVSANFIQKNSAQYQKNIQAFDTCNDSAVTVVSEQEGNTFYGEGAGDVGVKREDTSTLAVIFEDIQKKRLLSATCLEKASCLILSRFKHILPSNDIVQYYQHSYPHLTIRLSTIHASKGQEADYVIILGVNSGEYGLPSEKENELSGIKKGDESFPYAQERRVFYVAMTRAKKHVYIVGNPRTPSVFIQELLEQSQTEA